MSDISLEPAENEDIDQKKTSDDIYWQEFRKQVHILLLWGYTDSKGRVQPQHDEPAITGFIAEAIKARLNDPDCPEWCENIATPHDDEPIAGGGRIGRGRWRPDIHFELLRSGRKPRPEYHFEAKRLRQPGSGTKDYLGAEGLHCFLQGMYAPQFREAGMLGYVQCDTVDIWTQRLKIAIEQDFQNSNSLLLISPQHNIQIIDEFAHEWLSDHSRHTGNSIRIHHVLLDYRVDPNAQPKRKCKRKQEA